MRHFPASRCEACPLFDPNKKPARAERGSDRLFYIYDAASYTDARQGRAMASAFDRAGLAHVERVAGVKPTALPVVACGGYWSLEPAQRPVAVEACRARLPILGQGQVVLTAGLLATQAYLPGTRKLDAVLGAPVEAPCRATVLPVLPQHDLDKARKPAYREPQSRWYDKARRVLDGTYAWEWPRIVTSADGEAALLAAIEEMRASKICGLDVETNRLTRDTYVNWPDIHLLDIGVGSPELNLALDVTWDTASNRVREAMFALLRQDRTWVLHNGLFDFRVFHYKGIEVGGTYVDTMHAFRLCWPGVREGLDTVAAFLSDAPRWKDEFREEKGDRDFDGSSASDDADQGEDGEEAPDLGFYEKRGVYCAKDSYLQAWLWINRIFPKLARVTDGPRRFAERMTAVHLARRMTLRGIRVDPEARARHHVKLEAEVERWATEVREIVGESTGFFDVKKRVSGDVLVPRPMNPASLRDVTKAFDALGQAPLGFTETGQPQWDEEVLQGLVTSPKSGVRELAHALLKFREYAKAFGTYVKKLPVFADGYLHAEWKPQHANTTRWGSSNTNVQNIPKALRDMLVARPGYVVVEADFNAQELRWVAQVAKIKGMLDVFQSGGDLHNDNTAFIFKMGMDEVKRRKKESDTTPFVERDLAKMVQLSMDYCASAATIWSQIVVKPAFREVKLSYVEWIREQLLKKYPELETWWAWTQREAIEKGVICVPFSNHELFTFGHFDPALMTNFQIQGAGGWQMNMALRKIGSYIGWDESLAIGDLDGPAILANQHDASWTEWPEDRAEEGARMVRELSEMTVDLNGTRLHYPVEVKLGRGFGSRDLKKV